MFEIKDFLEKNNFEFELYEDTYFIARNSKILIRGIQETNLLQVGMRETFDRWANSSDIEFKYPYTEKDMDQILKEVDLYKRCTKKHNGRYRCTNWVKNSKGRVICDDCLKRKHEKSKEKRKNHQRRNS